MSERTTPARAAAARRPKLSQTIVSVAATAIAIAALIWSGLFYDATRKHAALAATAAPPAAAPAATGAAKPAPAVAPVTTRTS
jgi:hypothetical protein